MQVRPVVLTGHLVRLAPLDADHAQGLYNRGQQQRDWDYLPRPCFIDLADTRHWIDEALSANDQVAFAIVENGRGRAVGSTRYLNIRPEHRSLEIGWTWLGRDWQRTALNTETKLLLLTHAFEQLGCVRVEFKTDLRNARSQKALQRMVATREGVLRNHMIVQGSHVRDSVYYSVIDREWPTVKQQLLKLLARTQEA